MRFLYERFDDPDTEGHRFYFMGFGHVPPEVVLEAEAWCVERFGPNPENLRESKDCRWFGNGDDIYFRDEDDALQFRLRWC